MVQAVFSEEFKKRLRKIKKKDKPLFDRLEKKIRSLLLEPTHIKHLKNTLKGKQRVHIGPFVLIFELEKNTVYFITLEHHDDAY